MLAFIESVPWAREADVERDRIHLGAYAVKCFAEFRTTSSRPSQHFLKEG
jgi:hypothetical protein